MIKPLFKRPLFFSTVAHLVLLASFVLIPAKVPTKKESLKVLTIHLQPKTSTISKPPVKSPAPSPPKPASSKTSPQVKVTKKKPAAKKAPTKSISTEKSPPKSSAKAQPKSATNNSSNLKSSPKAQPKSSTNNSSNLKSAPAALSALPAFFQQSLLLFFEEHLEMPEVGQVTLKITFNKLGKIDQIEILASESRKNELYLLKALKHLNIPHPQKGTFKPLVVEFGNALKNL